MEPKKKNDHTTDKLVFTSVDRVGALEMDANRFLLPHILLQKMQAASMRHTIELQLSSWSLMEKGMSWVLLAQDINIVNPLTFDERMTIITYPSGFDKFFTYRDYLVFGEDKKLAYTSSSKWSLIDTETKKLIGIPAEISGVGTPENVKFLKRPESLKLDFQNVENADERQVRAFDTDWNNHLNNTVAAKWLLESLWDSPKISKLEKITVQYKNEVTLGGKVVVLKQDHNDHAAGFLKRTTDEKLVAYCDLKFSK